MTRTWGTPVGCIPENITRPSTLDEQLNLRRALQSSLSRARLGRHRVEDNMAAVRKFCTATYFDRLASHSDCSAHLPRRRPRHQTRRAQLKATKKLKVPCLKASQRKTCLELASISRMCLMSSRRRQLVSTIRDLWVQFCIQS